MNNPGPAGDFVLFDIDLGLEHRVKPRISTGDFDNE